MEAKKQGPVARFTTGAVEATVWENESIVRGERVVAYAVRVGRTYKDASGALKTATSFNVRELPRALLVLAQAYAALLDQQLTEDDEGTADRAAVEGAWTS